MLITRPENEEMRAQVQLLKALIQTKSNLSYQINQLKIKNSYRSSNTDFRDFKDMANLAKVLTKKFQDLKSTNFQINSDDIKRIPSETFNKLIQAVLNSEVNMQEIDEIISENQDSERLLRILREKYENLYEQLSEGTEVFRRNEYFVKEFEEKQRVVHLIEEEINDYKEEIEVFNAHNQMLNEKLQKIKQNRRKSIENIRSFQKLSENALKLRSKLLFRKELKQNIKSAELELEFHSEKIEKEKKRLEELESEYKELKKNEPKLIQEMTESEEKLKKIEKKLQSYCKERDELNYQITQEIRNEKEAKNREAESNVTLSLIGILTGFSDIQREKQLLILENQKIKQRIANLLN